jgi:hypothetical protein
MPGERSYSAAAVAALCDAYYNTNPRPRVEDIKAAAGRREVENVDPAIQAEIAQISRARMFELLREDPRHNDTELREAALNTIRERIHELNTEGIKGWGQSREMDKLLEALDNAQRRAHAWKPVIHPPEPTNTPETSVGALLARIGEPSS